MRIGWSAPLGAVCFCVFLTGCPADPEATPDGTAEVGTDTNSDSGDTAPSDTPDTDAGGLDSDLGPPDTDTGGIDADTSGPDTDTSGPDADTTVPDADTTVPDADTSGPDTDAGEPDADTVEPDADTVEIAAPVTLEIGTLDGTEFCPGATLEVPVTITGGSETSYDVDVQLSDASGSFDDEIVIGSATITGSGVISCTISPDAMDPGHRIRLVADGVASADNGEDLTVLPAPDLSAVNLIRSYAILGSAKGFGATNGATADSWAWDFGANATPATSDLKSPQWTHDTVGVHTVTVTASIDAGCSVSKSIDVKVLDCNSAVINPGTVVKEDDQSLLNPPSDGAWLCFGANTAIISGDDGAPIFVEPGASTDVISSDVAVFAVAGSTATLSSTSDVILFYEAGANVDPDDAYDSLECPDLVFDRSNAPANGCTTEGATPFFATVGTLPTGDSCPLGPLDVPYTTDAAPGANNVFVVEMSDGAGDFTAPVTIAQVASSMATGTLDATLPTALAAADGYKLRIRTTDPPGLGPVSSDSVSIGAPLNPAFTMSANFVLEDDPVTMTLTSTDPYESVLWDFGQGGTPTTSTEANPSVSWDTTGFKTVTLTLTAPGGCQSSVTNTDLRVMSCSATAPSSTQRVTTLDENATGSAPFLACGGATMTVYSSKLNFVQTGGGAEFYSNDDLVVYAEAGAAITNDDNNPEGVLVADDEAVFGDISGFAAVLTCTDLVIDDSAVSGTCPPYTPQPDSLTIDAAAPTDWCPNAEVEMSYTLTGAFPPGADLELWMSDATGSFANATKLDTDYGGNSSSFDVEVPDIAPGTYMIRPEVILPAFVGEAVSITIHPGPTAAYTPSTQYLMEGDSVTFVDASTGDGLTYQWSFPGGDPSSATGPDPGPVSYATAGEHDTTLTVTNSGGCSATAGDYYERILVHSCNPVLDADAKLVGNEGFSDDVLVCDGMSGSNIGGSPIIFIQAGGSYTHDGGGSYTGYVKAGGTFTGADFGGNTIAIYEAGATLVNEADMEFTFECPTLTFDTSQVTGPLCP